MKTLMIGICFVALFAVIPTAEASGYHSGGYYGGNTSGYRPSRHNNADVGVVVGSAAGAFFRQLGSGNCSGGRVYSAPVYTAPVYVAPSQPVYTAPCAAPVYAAYQPAPVYSVPVVEQNKYGWRTDANGNWYNRVEGMPVIQDARTLYAGVPPQTSQPVYSAPVYAPVYQNGQAYTGAGLVTVRTWSASGCQTTITTTTTTTTTTR